MSEQSKLQSAATWKTVKDMYEAYPYPSPIVGDSVIDDVANCLYSLYGQHALEHCSILDAGCGTGHRLIGAARRYPLARFTGLDITVASLEVAKRLAEKHRVHNVELVRGNLLELKVPGQFDVVISTGVIHHLEDPVRGLRNLAARLAPNGLLIIWLYHTIGERERLLSRELLHLMWDTNTGLECGLQMMRDLGLQLEVKRYGSSGAQSTNEVSQLNIDVDAYLHPIVNAYTFEEAFSMLRSCHEIGWAAINNINLANSSKLVDLAEVDKSDMSDFCQSVDDLFRKDTLKQRFRELANMDKLRVLEIKLKPTGFTVLAGRSKSYNELGPRIAGGVLEW
jgi:SAM-dependent methyltransferase